MENRDPKYNLRVNHRLLNYIFANYQGKFTALNIRYQLNHPSFKRSELELLKQNLKAVKSYLDEIKDNKLIFRVEKPTEEILAKQQDIMLKLKQLKPILKLQAEQSENLLANQHYQDNPDLVVELVALYGAHTYAKDNYIRGHIDFSHLVDDPMIIESYHQQRELVSIETKLVHDVLNFLKNPEKITDRVYQHLKFVSRILPGSFRAAIHDVNEYLAINEPEFTFTLADFTREEETLWKSAGIGAIEAGYWKAFDFSTDEAIVWSEIGIIEPYLAYEWKTIGLNAQDSIEWIRLNFSPLLAIQWINSGLGPIAATRLIAAGFQFPSDIPPEKAQEIFAKIFADMRPAQESSTPKRNNYSDSDEDDDDHF